MCHDFLVSLRYLNSAKDASELESRRNNVLGAYKALTELKAAGKVDSIGVGAKDISAVDFISDHVQLDWAMLACSVTPYTHSEAAKALLKKLGGQGVKVVNSAVFNSGFLVGGEYFDYRKVTVETDPEIFAWRDKFLALCSAFSVDPPSVCVQFSFLFPEIVAVALNTDDPQRVRSNIQLANAVIPDEFWARMRTDGLINV